MSEAPRWHRWLDALPAGGALATLGLLLYTSSARLSYPYDIEWMEGGMLVHALRVLEGKGIYVEPSADFIPMIYPPLYTWLVALGGALFGLDYTVGRAISLIGSLAGALALAVGLRKEGASPLYALAGAGLFLSCYEDAGTFYDLVRTDGLLIGLLGWALVSLRAGWLRSGGLLLTLAYATKHNAAALGLPCLLWLYAAQGRPAAQRFALWSVVPALIFTGLMHFEGDGLFLTYILGVPATHGFVLERFLPGIFLDLGKALPLCLALMATSLGLWLWRLRGPGPLHHRLVEHLSTGGAFWGMNAAMGLLFGALMRGHQGGYINVLIPAFWLLAMVGALTLLSLRQRWPGLPAMAISALLLCAELGRGRWEPTPEMPTARDRAAGEQVVARIRDMEGEVFAPAFPWYLHLAGKTPGVHLIAIWDIDHEGGVLRRGVGEVRQSIKDQRWSHVLFTQADLGMGLKESYKEVQRFQLPADALRTRTGWPARPQRVFRRWRDLGDSPAEAGAGAP